MMKKKKWFGILVLVLVPLMGCSSLPSTFIRASADDTTILLRRGLDPTQAFREAIFILTRHGFEPEIMNTEAGYIRTRWNYSWNDRNRVVNNYRVRVVVTFNPDRTQLILSTPAEFSHKHRWINGFDTRAIETLRTDLTQSIGN